MVNDAIPMKLLLKMSDLWIRHIQDAEPDDEINAELQELISMREQVLSIYSDGIRKQVIAETIPEQITAYLRETEAGVFPITVSVFNEQPKQYLIQCSLPMSRATYDELDDMFPDMIVLDRPPW